MSNALADLLSGKTPEAMYDALHAGRYLSESGVLYPARVLELIKSMLRSSRQRAFMPPTKLKRIVLVLAESGYLNGSGIELASQET
jgi:hypothetical protein